MEIKNIISEHLDEKLISNIIVDDYINENLQKKYKNVKNQFNMEKDDVYMFTNFLIKPHLIKIYENDRVYFQEDDINIEDIYSIDGEESNYDYDEDSDDSTNFYHHCIIDNSNCGYCRDCRSRFCFR